MTKLDIKLLFSKEFLFAGIEIFPRSEDEIVCPKCKALSEMLTISPMTITPDSIPLENLPLNSDKLLLQPLKSMSNSESYFSQTLTRISLNIQCEAYM